MADVLVLLAHPDLARSRVNRALAAEARRRADDGVALRDLYALYPDYVIDVEAEQAALAAARTIVWVHPVHWYAMPALMKLWVDDVLQFRWAYGPEGRALAGKRLWCVLSTGGTHESYDAAGSNGHAFADFLPPYRQTAGLTGLAFEPPLVFHGAHRATTAAIDGHARAFGDRLRAFAGAGHAAAADAAAPRVDIDDRGPAADERGRSDAPVSPDRPARACAWRSGATATDATD